MADGITIKNNIEVNNMDASYDLFKRNNTVIFQMNGVSVSNAIAFTLPTEWRPIDTVVATCMVYSSSTNKTSFAYMYVFLDGTIKVYPVNSDGTVDEHYTGNVYGNVTWVTN